MYRERIKRYLMDNYSSYMNLTIYDFTDTFVVVKFKNFSKTETITIDLEDL